MNIQRKNLVSYRVNASHTLVSVVDVMGSVDAMGSLDLLGTCTRKLQSE